MSGLDGRGAYVAVSDPSLTVPNSYTSIQSRLKAGGSYIAGRRGRLLLGVAALLGLGTVPYLWQHGPKALTSQIEVVEEPTSLDAASLAHLTLPLTGYKPSYLDFETAYVVGQHNLVQGNYPENYIWIDPYSRQPFENYTYENGNTNSAVGRMPAGSQYDALVVARGLNDLYNDTQEEIQYANLTIVGFFANYNAASKEWIRAGPEPYVLDLPVWRQYPRPCQNLVNGGAADPRLIWSDAGEPLAIMGTASRVSGVCKAVGMVDLRAVWPALREHLAETGYGDIPIKFDTFTEVGRAEEKQLYEKNWAPFFPGPKPAEPQKGSLLSFTSWQKSLPESKWPFFATQIVPRIVVEVDTSLDASSRSPDSYVLATDIDLSLPSNSTASFASSECILHALPQHWIPEVFHQATPFHRVTMCPRGTCEPSRANTVLLGLIHYKKGMQNYRRMFVTMSVDTPFNILSVSPPFHFGSVEYDEEVVFSVSLAFFPTKSAAELEMLEEGESPFKKAEDIPSGWLNHGWLDDTLVVGAGLRNVQYDTIHLPVATALRGHVLCP